MFACLKTFSSCAFDLFEFWITLLLIIIIIITSFGRTYSLISYIGIVTGKAERNNRDSYFCMKESTRSYQIVAFGTLQMKIENLSIVAWQPLSSVLSNRVEKFSWEGSLLKMFPYWCNFGIIRVFLAINFGENKFIFIFHALLFGVPTGNILLLKNNLNLTPDTTEVSQEKLLSLVAERLIDSNSNINVISYNLSFCHLWCFIISSFCRSSLLLLLPCCRIKTRVMLRINSRTLLMPLICFPDLQLGLM